MTPPPSLLPLFALCFCVANDVALLLLHSNNVTCNVQEVIDINGEYDAGFFQSICDFFSVSCWTFGFTAAGPKTHTFY